LHGAAPLTAVTGLDTGQERIVATSQAYLTQAKEGPPMSVEYLVLQAEAEAGSFARVTAHKRHQSWETLQAALDELGQDGWDLCTTIYSPTREQGGRGEHYCEGLIFKRMAASAEASASAEAQAIVAEAVEIVEREGDRH
jgi:hypothetical protein